MNDGNNNDSDNENDDSDTQFFAEITSEEINDFFERTDFIHIDAHLEGYDCGRCKRRLVGSWKTGWKWEYYCRDSGEDYHHMILSGSISVKTEEQLLEAVMTEYGAEEAGITENDCLDLIDIYKEYISDVLGGTKHEIGKNNYALAESNYMLYLMGYGPPPSPWVFKTPMNTDEN